MLSAPACNSLKNFVQKCARQRSKGYDYIADKNLEGEGSKLPLSRHPSGPLTGCERRASSDKPSELAHICTWSLSAFRGDTRETGNEVRLTTSACVHEQRNPVYIVAFAFIVFLL